MTLSLNQVGLSRHTQIQAPPIPNTSQFVCLATPLRLADNIGDSLTLIGNTASL